MSAKTSVLSAWETACKERVRQNSLQKTGSWERNNIYIPTMGPSILKPPSLEYMRVHTTGVRGKTCLCLQVLVCTWDLQWSSPTRRLAAPQSRATHSWKTREKVRKATCGSSRTTGGNLKSVKTKMAQNHDTRESLTSNTKSSLRMLRYIIYKW